MLSSVRWYFLDVTSSRSVFQVSGWVFRSCFLFVSTANADWYNNPLTVNTPSVFVLRVGQQTHGLMGSVCVSLQGTVSEGKWSASRAHFCLALCVFSSIFVFLLLSPASSNTCIGHQEAFPAPAATIKVCFSADWMINSCLFTSCLPTFFFKTTVLSFVPPPKPLQKLLKTLH